ncbi:hypothetical protein NDN11_12235 [Acinetobacter sp. C26M]|uniref:hypothetical protein n=1 Tax=unclassified Acinetobacter TaxID=196816 RepID=UPI00141E45E0|nr:MULTISPECIES: hypothetical protein [unclassified Acinetobacter]NIE96916.1 hypothetical protein [Acinetobacter sp. Tr-809]USA45484.1 hypothetical protein NDN11_12235 [Acinetobacter sp. C26M]USA48986.1 hypothetical protein NDN12_12235 [Acinetobacter sp. C26G]
MKKWICLSCRKYKRFESKDFKEGDVVFFYQFEIDAEEVYKIIREGVVLKRKNNILKILNNGEIFYLRDQDVYPIDAPAKFIYNMFGVCCCSFYKH